MKIAALTSGGKDSMFAAFQAAKENELVCLITLLPKRADSYMFHVPNLHLVPLQAEAMCLPVVMKKSSGIKEKELVDLKKALAEAKKKFGIQGICSGALYSQYQKERVDRICNELKLKSIAPLWHIDLDKYLEQLLDNRFDIIFTGIAAQGFDEKWLGRSLDEKAIADLKKLREKFQINIGGEGGEFESLVQNMPMFKKRLEIVKAHKKMENEFTGHLIVDDAKLV